MRELGVNIELSVGSRKLAISASLEDNWVYIGFEKSLFEAGSRIVGFQALCQKACELRGSSLSSRG